MWGTSWMGKAEKRRLLRAKAMFIGLFMAVLLAAFGLVLYRTQARNEEMLAAGGLVELHDYVARAARGEPVNTDATFEGRIFVIARGPAGGYSFLAGEREFGSFVIQHIDSFPVGDFTRIDGILISGWLTIDGVPYCSGLGQGDEFQRERASFLELAWALLAVYLLVFVMLLVSSHFIFLPVEEMFRKQREFVQNASHELKTPITVIDANCCVLQSEVGENEWFQNILQETKRMGTIVQDMLDLAGLDKTDEPPQTVDLSSLVTRHQLAFDALAFEQGIQYFCEVEDNIRVKGSPKALEQLLNQLTDNAMKYTEGDKAVRVALDQEGKCAVLTFYNSGCRIKDSERDHVFERFYRSEAAAADPAKRGSGIGLSIIKSICDKYGYRLHLDTEEGVFTRFTVTMRCV